MASGEPDHDLMSDCEESLVDSALERLSGSQSSSITSTSSISKRKGIRPRIRAWNIKILMEYSNSFNGNSVATAEKSKLLAEHIRSRICHTKPLYVSFIIFFCDSDMLNRTSIHINGYVQTNEGCTVSAMKTWINSSFEATSCKPIPGGLASDTDFQNEMLLVEDQSNSWTRLRVFGDLGMNNDARTKPSALLDRCPSPEPFPANFCLMYCSEFFV